MNDVNSSDTASDKDPAPHGGESESASGRVLIVEDDPDSQYVYGLFLEHRGFEVLSAGNGEEGIRLAQEEKPDVILMDISIPVIDGWSATEQLKAKQETASIPVIAITAHAFPEDRKRAREVGCDGFLTKPCDPRDVVNEILRVLDR